MGTAVLLHRPQHLGWRGWYSERDREYVLDVVPLLLAVGRDPAFALIAAWRRGFFSCCEILPGSAQAWTPAPTLGQGQGEVEDRPVAQLAGYTDFAAVGFDDGLGNCQTHARALDL